MIFFTPNNWFWQRADGKIYSSKVRRLIDNDDPDYLAWHAAGGLPPLWPRDSHGEETVAALDEALVFYGQPPSGLVEG